MKKDYKIAVAGTGLAAVSSSAFAALYSAFGKYDVVHIHAEGPAFFACGTALSSDSAGRDFTKERSWLFNGDALAR